jgi:hypothetical protein
MVKLAENPMGLLKALERELAQAPVMIAGRQLWEKAQW